MKKLSAFFLFFIFLQSFSWNFSLAQISPCSLKQILPNPLPARSYSPDSSKYFINLQDTVGGVFQIYVGNKTDTVPVCISKTYSNGNCCGLFRHWSSRNKLQVQWEPSGRFIICAVEKEFYNELLYVPYSLRLGWLQSGLWMDIWAVTPDGNNWYNLANTIHGFTGPAFTPDGSKCAWAEALDSSNLAIDVFGKWKLWLSDFVINNGIPSFSSASNINPAGSRWIEPGNFSIDGHSLLVSSDIGISNAEGQDQFILDINNGNIVNLNNSPGICDEHGVFSPDGNKILFMSSYPYRSDTNSYHTTTIKAEFMLMNRDGSGLEQLTHYCDTGYIESSAGIAATGIWTKDGSRIYAQSLIFPDYENWIIDFNGNCGNNTITSVPELTDNKLRLYPNLVLDMIYLEAAFDLSDSRIIITNTFGQTIKNISGFHGNWVSIKAEDLKSGIYFLQLKTGLKIMTRMFIKND